MIDTEELDRILDTLSPLQFAVYVAYIEYPSNLLYYRTLPTYRQISSSLQLPQYIVGMQAHWMSDKGLSFERIRELREEKEREKTPTEKAFEEGRGNLGPLEHVVLKELKKYDTSDTLKVKERIAQFLYVRPHVVEKIFSRLRRRGLLEKRREGRKQRIGERIEEIVKDAPNERVEEKTEFEIPAEDQRLYDLLKNHPERSYLQIARDLGTTSKEVTRKVLVYRREGLLEKRKRGTKLKIKEYIPKKLDIIKVNLLSPEPVVWSSKGKNVERDRRIVEAFLEGELYVSIGKREALSKQAVYRIVRRNGFSNEDRRDVRRGRIKEKEELCQTHQRLVNELQQYYFNRLIEERGLPHALAWRYFVYHRHDGNYTIEQLEKVIELRLQGHGYHRCIRGAGIATESAEIRSRTPQFAKILAVSLADVQFEKPEIRFGDRKYLTTTEKEAEFVEMYGKIPYKEITAKLGIPQNSITYHAKRLGLSKKV